MRRYLSADGDVTVDDDDVTVDDGDVTVDDGDVTVDDNDVTVDVGDVARNQSCTRTQIPRPRPYTLSREKIQKPTW